MVLAIGGLDPSAGAGILADVRTLDASGVAPAAVATATTIQSGRGLLTSRALAANAVAAAMDEICDAFEVRWIKVGQIPTRSCALAIAKQVAARQLSMVLDPVVTASGGGALASPAARQAIADRLLPLAAVVTVNLEEAASLSGLPVRGRRQIEAAARQILKRRAGAVVVKGGHAKGALEDLLLFEGPKGVVLKRFPARRISGPKASMHGTGCAFASALAAALSRGIGLPEAVAQAGAHVRSLLRGAQDFGHGRILRGQSL